jgi:FKBP-type peptidyl-prolyl cis-trans isomerase SlyD
MKIQDNHVVCMHYTLTSDEGNVIDSSAGRDALDYIQGQGMIVPGLEKAMLGKAVGDKFTVVVPAAEGYGEYNPALVQEIPLEAFQGVPNVEVGMTFVARGPQGQTMVTITEVKEKVAVANANHELAGKNLNFAIEVTEVRDATANELENGLHAHGGGCCGGGCGGGSDEDDSISEDAKECCGGTKHEDPTHECCGGGNCSK